MASDRTSQTGEATAGFVQRPTIPPRSRRVTSHSPLEIAAEYRAIVQGKRIGRPPLGPDMRVATVYLPEAAYAELEALAGKSGKKGFKRPGLSETCER